MYLCSFSWSFFCALLFVFGLSPFTRSGRRAGLVRGSSLQRAPRDTPAARPCEGDGTNESGRGSAAEKRPENLVACLSPAIQWRGTKGKRNQPARGQGSCAVAKRSEVERC